MKKIIAFLREYLELSIHEAKGALLLFTIIVFSLAITFSYSNFSSSIQSEIVIKEYGDTPIPKENEENIKDSKNFSSNYKNKESYQKKIFKRFNFDPNNASEQQLIDLGFPSFTAKTIIKYRLKGGKFKIKEDLLKIYSLKPALYESLESLILLPAKIVEKKYDNQEYVVITSNQKAPISTDFEKNKKGTEKFDINIADTSQLIQINGIGSVLAKRIIKYRDLLGGFYHLDQIQETYGIKPEVINEILKNVFIGSAVKKIKINQIANQKHPYLNFNQIKIIIAFKKQHGNFKTLADLKDIKILDEITISKISPYIDYEN